MIVFGNLFVCLTVIVQHLGWNAKWGRGQTEEWNVCHKNHVSWDYPYPRKIVLDLINPKCIFWDFVQNEGESKYAAGLHDVKQIFLQIWDLRSYSMRSSYKVQS